MSVVEPSTGSEAYQREHEPDGKPPHRVPSFVSVAQFFNFDTVASAHPTAAALDVRDANISEEFSTSSSEDAVATQLAFEHEAQQALLLQQHAQQHECLAMKQHHQEDIRQFRSRHAALFRPCCARFGQNGARLCCPDALSHMQQRHSAEQALLQKEQAFQLQQVVQRHRHREELRKLHEKHGLPVDGHDHRQEDNAITHVPSSDLSLSMGMDVVDTTRPFTTACNGQDRSDPDHVLYPLYPVIDQRDTYQAAPTGSEQACMTTAKCEATYAKHIIYSSSTKGNKKNRGRYRCSKCGAAKAGHICKFKKLKPGDLLRPKRPSITWVRSVSTQADTALTGATGRALADLPGMPLSF